MMQPACTNTKKSDLEKNIHPGPSAFCTQEASTRPVEFFHQNLGSFPEAPK